MYVKGTNAFFLERACVSSMPFAIDDLQKQTSRNTSVNVSDLIIDLYNGTKTTAGSLTSSMYVKGTNAFFLERACVSSMPFAIDDLQKQTSRNTSVNVSDLIIDLYNGTKTTNLHKGSLKPKSAPLVATNYDIKSDDQYSLHLDYCCFSMYNTVVTV